MRDTFADKITKGILFIENGSKELGIFIAARGNDYGEMLNGDRNDDTNDNDDWRWR